MKRLWIYFEIKRGDHFHEKQSQLISNRDYFIFTILVSSRKHVYVAGFVVNKLNKNCEMFLLYKCFHEWWTFIKLQIQKVLSFSQMCPWMTGCFFEREKWDTTGKLQLGGNRLFITKVMTLNHHILCRPYVKKEISYIQANLLSYY